jgi:hypothetical protein
VDVIKALGQVAQDELRVGPLGQDVKQVSGGHEVEAAGGKERKGREGRCLLL